MMLKTENHFQQRLLSIRRFFSNIYVSLIRAGEKSGLLDKVLLRLADNMEKQQKLKSTIKGALMYPIIVVILMGVVIAVMMIFVIPQLTALYEMLNVELPLPTRIVMTASDLTISFGQLF
jgi:type IV pilus assembly protein PilC